MSFSSSLLVIVTVLWAWNESSILALAQQKAAPAMVSIPAGEFWMGRTVFFETDADGSLSRERRDDTPAHKVYVDAFYMDTHEVTNEEYARFIAANPNGKRWYWPGGKVAKGEEQFPVHDVNWDEASAFCTWAGKRLPTEAEWERASRAGLDRQRFPWGNDDPAMLAHFGYPWGPVPVASFSPNAYGLYDMAGNVWEWVNDWYGSDYYPIAPRKNPKGPETGTYKVIRGGGWADTDRQDLMNHYRNYTNPAARAFTVGFRCAKDS
jgi:formylglycine-generating enzyme required for sulfatase activity